MHGANAGTWPREFYQASARKCSFSLSCLSSINWSNAATLLGAHVRIHHISPQRFNPECCLRFPEALILTYCLAIMRTNGHTLRQSSFCLTVCACSPVSRFSTHHSCATRQCSDQFDLRPSSCIFMLHYRLTTGSRYCTLQCRDTTRLQGTMHLRQSLVDMNVLQRRLSCRLLHHCVSLPAPEALLAPRSLYVHINVSPSALARTGAQYLSNLIQCHPAPLLPIELPFPLLGIPWT